MPRRVENTDGDPVPEDHCDMDLDNAGAITLVPPRQLGHARESEDSERAELMVLPKAELRQLAKEAGATAEQLSDVLDCEDEAMVEAYVDLLLDLKSQSQAQSDDAKLRAELMAVTNKELRQQATKKT